MRLTYQVGIAALIHLSVITLFNIANGVQSSVQQCTGNDTDCIGGMITNMLYFIVTSLWFGAVWLLAVAAQEKRSRKLLVLLMMAEFMILAVASFNFQHGSNPLGRVTSLVDMLLAVWVGILAARLWLAGGGRVTSSQRARKRRLDKTDHQL